MDIVHGKFREITQLTFTVKEVKDSNNIIYSYITKKGVNPVNTGLTYEKQYIIACDGNTMSIPWDFYTPGIVYFSNWYYNASIKAKTDTGLHISITFQKDVKLKFPVGAGNAGFSVVGEEIVFDVFKRAFSIDHIGGRIENASFGSIYENTKNYEALIINQENRESKIIKTPIGDFNCTVSKVLVDFRKKKDPEIGYKHYYTPEAGVVRVEGLYSNFKHISEYVELVSIKQ
jgi:hypothetical protein